MPFFVRLGQALLGCRIVGLKKAASGSRLELEQQFILAVALPAVDNWLAGVIFLLFAAELGCCCHLLAFGRFIFRLGVSFVDFYLVASDDGRRVNARSLFVWWHNFNGSFNWTSDPYLLRLTGRPAHISFLGLTPTLSLRLACLLPSFACPVVPTASPLWIRASRLRCLLLSAAV